MNTEKCNLARDGDNEIEEMDDGDAIRIDMQEIAGGDILHPMTYSNDTEKEKENAKVVGLIQRELNKVSLRTSECSIYRVPATLFKENPDAYIPRMVSIGPLHHDKQHLQHKQELKIQYFKEFLSRSSPSKSENYVKAMADLAEKAYRCYSEVTIEIKREKFVMMMLVDGCFMLELLLKLKDGVEYTVTSFEQAWLILDLVLLENQLPLFVLEKLYQIFIGDSDGADDKCTLKVVIRQTWINVIKVLLFGEVKNESLGQIDQISPESEPKHLLDLLRRFFIPSSSPIPLETNDEMKKQKPMVRAIKSLLACASQYILPRLCVEEEDNSARRYIVSAQPMRCATELKNANVKFQSNKNPKSLCDINFDNANGVLTVPPIMIQDITERILRNLIAFEVYTDYSYITEYISFIAALINSTNDVEILHESGIFSKIIDVDPSDVAKLFKSLPKYVTVPDEFKTPTCRKVMNYYRRPWHKWKASLMLNYFNTPWAFISVVAAIILLILTIMQTIYAALSYHY